MSLIPWLFLAAVCVAAFAVSRTLVFLLASSLPIERRTAIALAQDWSTIGAFVLGAWFLITVTTGPSYPLVASATTFILGGSLLITARYAYRNEQFQQRNPIRRFLVIWLGGSLLTGLIAYMILMALALIILTPAPPM
jgi:hypothetical protein